MMVAVSLVCQVGTGMGVPERLVVPVGNFPTMTGIAAWEQEFGKPVVTTNQAALWAILKAMQINTALPGKGRLLERMPEG